MRLRIELDETYDGDPQFWSGHGHAFAPKNLVACLAIGFAINYTETVQEIIDRIKEELPLTEFDPVNEKLFKKYEDKIRSLSDADFIKAFKRSLKKGVKPTDRFFNVDESLADSDDEIYDPPMLLCYFHIYLE